MTPRQRIISTTYRLLTTTGEAQHRAFDRLCCLTSFIVTFEMWLKTKPDPTVVNSVVNDVLLVSPMRPMIRSKV